MVFSYIIYTKNSMRMGHLNNLSLKYPAITDDPHIVHTVDQSYVTTQLLSMV